LHITSGRFAGQGGGDLGLQVLFKALPEFEHKIVFAAPIRVWTEIGREDGICSFSMGRTEEREKLALFSDRPLWVPGYTLITTDDHVRFFDRYRIGGVVDLERLAGAIQLNVGFMTGRPYPRAINNLQYRIPVVSAAAMQPLFRQLAAHRLDLLFSSIAEATYFDKVLHLDGHFVSLPVRGIPAGNGAYIVCSKGPIGSAVMTRINQVLADDATWEEFVEPWRQWYNDEAMAMIRRGNQKDGQ